MSAVSVASRAMMAAFHSLIPSTYDRVTVELSLLCAPGASAMQHCRGSAFLFVQQLSKGLCTLTFHRLHHATSGGEKYAHMTGNALHCLEDACHNRGAA